MFPAFVSSLEVDIKGYDTTMGYSSYADKPATEDAHVSRVFPK